MTTCAAASLWKMSWAEWDRDPCTSPLGHDGQHQYRHNGQVVSKWGGPAYRVIRRAPFHSGDESEVRGACGVVVAPGRVEAWMTAAAHFKGRLSEAVLVYAAGDSLATVSVGPDAPTGVEAAPFVYDEWRVAETAAVAWATAREVLRGRITWAAAKEEPMAFEQLDLLAGI